jgi:hypothetical protein
MSRRVCHRDDGIHDIDESENGALTYAEVQIAMKVKS